MDKVKDSSMLDPTDLKGDGSVALRFFHCFPDTSKDSSRILVEAILLQALRERNSLC